MTATATVFFEINRDGFIVPVNINGQREQGEHREPSPVQTLFGQGTDVHLPSQENEIQPISQQPTSVSKFIICLFRHAVRIY